MNLTELKAAIRRLERSDTPRKRKSARQAVRSAAGTIIRDLETAYPNLRADGTPAPQSRGASCPCCKQPMRTWGQLVRHLVARHRQFMTDNNSLRPYRCICGKEGTLRGMVQHLQRVTDLGVHFAAGVILDSANAGPLRFVVSPVGAMLRKPIRGRASKGVTDAWKRKLAVAKA